MNENIRSRESPIDKLQRAVEQAGVLQRIGAGSLNTVYSAPSLPFVIKQCRKKGIEATVVFNAARDAAKKAFGLVVPFNLPPKEENEPVIFQIPGKLWGTSAIEVQYPIVQQKVDQALTAAVALRLAAQQGDIEGFFEILNKHLAIGNAALFRQAYINDACQMGNYVIRGGKMELQDINAIVTQPELAHEIIKRKKKSLMGRGILAAHVAMLTAGLRRMGAGQRELQRLEDYTRQLSQQLTGTKTGSLDPLYTGGGRAMPSIGAIIDGLPRG